MASLYDSCCKRWDRAGIGVSPTNEEMPDFITRTADGTAVVLK